MTRLLLIALALWALPARANCACDVDAQGDCAGPVTCDPATFNGLVHDAQQAEHDRDVALATAKRLTAQLAACTAHVKTLEDAPPATKPWPWALTGAGVGLVVGVVVGVLVHAG